MPNERQQTLPEQPSLARRGSLSRAMEQRRRYYHEQGKWGTKASIMFLTLAELWRTSVGSNIAQQSGQSVEDIAAEMGYNTQEKEFRTVLRKMKRANTSAKRVAGLMARETEIIARKTNDQIGWTASFLDSSLNILGQEFRLKPSYVQKLKVQAFQRPLSLAS